MSIIEYFILIISLMEPVYSQRLNVTLNLDEKFSVEDLKDCYHKTNPTLFGKRQDVYIGVAIMDIDQVNEGNMDFRLHSYVYVIWKNREMNIQIENQTKPLLLPPELSNCMWKPDIMFPNTEEILTFVDMVPNRGFKYYATGEIYLVERFMFRVSCPMEFSLYPLDSQHCYFKIALMINSDEKVLLHWKKDIGKGGVFYYYDIEPLQFRISDPIPDSATEIWVTGNFTELWTNITFHRRLTGSVINYYLPSSLVVVLSWLSFYIDVEAAPARVTLGVTALLTITTQMIQARNALPPVQYVTSLDVWLFFCLSLVFGSFIEYSIAYTFSNSVVSKNSVSSGKKTTKKISSGINEKSIRVGWTSEAEKPKVVKRSRNKFDIISRIIFPIIMIIFTVTYWTYLFLKTEINVF